MAGEAHQAPWLTQGDDKRKAVRQMFSDIAGSYDLVNSVVSARGHYRWRRAAVRHLDLQPGDTVLDVCCGTGDFLLPLRNAVGTEGTVDGLDFCRPMLAVAQQKLGDQARLLHGDACSLPVASGQYDAVTVGWGLRNVPDLDLALREIARVLKPGGKFVTLDMTQADGAFGRISASVFQSIVPLIGRLFGKAEAYKYLPKSTLTFVTAAELEERLKKAGFSNVGSRRFAFGNVGMHWGTKA